MDGDSDLTPIESDAPSDLTSLAASAPPSDSDPRPSSPPECRLPSSSPSLSPLSSAGESSATRNHSQSFRSIISTRRQKAKEIEATSQLVTPPLSEDAASVPETSTPRKRMTRSTSSSDLRLQKVDKGKRRAKETSSTPTMSLSSSRATTAKKDEIRIKKEEVEPRSLRARPATVNVLDAAKEPPPKPEVPIGPDGKPLPTCVTCSNVLPVISVDSQIVWGLGVEDSPKKKKIRKQECPRCMRHNAIYGRPWPCRIPTQGVAFLPTPREATPVESTSSRILQKSLSVLDHKLAASVSSSNRRTKHKRDEDIIERPKKRRKSEPVRVEAVPKVTKPLLKENDKKRHSLPAPAVPEKRKRGRPRKHPLPEQLDDKGELPDNESASNPQPRNTNGRFEKKFRSPKTVHSVLSVRPERPMGLSSRAERAIERQKARCGDDNGTEAGIWTSPRRKRSLDELHFEELPAKRPYRRREQNPEPLKRILPRSTMNFRGGRLFSNPNPLSFALQAWAGPVTFDESSSEEEKAPVTPEDIQSPPATIVVGDDDLISAPVLSRGALTFKPSPFTFAKRRWLSSSSHDGKKLQDDSEFHTASARSNAAHTSPAKHGHVGSSSIRKSEIELAYSSDEGYPLYPVSNDSTVRVLRHSYPNSHPSFHQDAPVAFMSNERGPPPSLVHAGWDSCSSESD